MKTSINFRVDETLKDQIAKIASKKDMTISDLIREILENYVLNQEIK